MIPVCVETIQPIRIPDDRKLARYWVPVRFFLERKLRGSTVSGESTLVEGSRHPVGFGHSPESPAKPTIHVGRLLQKVLFLGFVLIGSAGCVDDPESELRPRSVAVQADPISIADISLKRTFSGSLEAAAEFVVSPKMGGRVKSMHVDLGDRITRGQVVVELDDAEFRQQAAQARAEVAVAEATVAEAHSALTIANRELDRVEALRKRGIASDTRLDASRATQQAATARRLVADAQLQRAKAALRGALVRLGYTRIAADWEHGDAYRVVAERFVDEGETVAPNAALLSIVELDPILGVIYVPERDYARLEIGAPVSLTTDAFPRQRFEARIQRIAPVFRPGSRQARVELRSDNPDQRLKPGLFIRATLTLERVESATVVPQTALAARGDQTGVFVVNESQDRVAWRRVKVGIRDGDRVQVSGEHLNGLVVTLGQHLLDDGSLISLQPTEAVSGGGMTK